MLSITAFESISAVYLLPSYGENAKLVSLLPYILMIFLTPFFGFLIDQVGKKTIFSKRIY
jgi:hypothetical protein